MKLASDDKDRNIFVYEPLHRHHSLQDEVEKQVNNANEAVIKLAIKSRLFKRLNAEEPFLFHKSKIHLYNDSRLSFKDEIPELVNYTKVKTDSVFFFEVLEIDEFEKFGKRILQLAKSKANRKTKFFVSATSIEDTKKNLASIKTSFDTISYGEFFSLSFKESTKTKFSLIEYLRFSYVKTSESYFIINLEITPSKLFHSSFEKIVAGEAGFIDFPHFNNIFAIIKGRWAEKYSSMKTLKGENLSNLFKDLNYQAQIFLKEYFSGVFLSATKKYYLPSLENFTVSNLEEFNKDRGLTEYFDRKAAEVFIEEWKHTEIIFPRIEKDFYTHNAVKVVKEKSDTVNADSDGTEYYVHRELLRAISTPWTLINILNLYWNNISELKRDVYDFIKENSKQSFINRFLRFFTTQKIIQLKYDLAKYRVIFTRFEKEFNQNNLWIYTRHFDLSKFRQKGSDKPEHNLQKYVQHRIKYPIDRLEGEIKIINENFTRIEEINSFRTNLFLQYTSILLSLLALIFTFDKVKAFCIWLWVAIETRLK